MKLKKNGQTVMITAVLIAFLLPITVAASGAADSGAAASGSGEKSGEVTVALWRDLEADPNHPAFSVHQILQQWNRMYPGVELKYELNGGQSVTDKFTWIKTRMMSQTLPDLVMIYFPDDSYFDRDLMYDLAPELEKKNPYSDNARWRDDFPHDAEIIRAKTMPDGGVYVAGYTQSGNVGATAFVYNKDIFDEVGVKPPVDWADFLDIQKKIKAAGYTPFLQPMAGPLGWLIDWSRWVIQWQLLDGIAKDIDIEAPFGEMSQKEVARAVKKGIFRPDDPRYMDSWRMVKEWSQYWQEGFLAPPEGDMFVEGKAAMQHTMTLWIPQIAQNPNVTFKWGTFYQPQITKESSQYATGAIPQRVGNSGAPASASMFFMIPQTTVKSGRFDLALDLLQYATAPAQLDFWCTAQTIPCFDPGTPIEKVYPGDEDMQRQMAGFFDPPAFENGSSNLYLNAISRDLGTQLLKLLQEYLGDAMSLEEAIAELTEMVDVALEDAIASHPEWNAKDW